MTSAAGGAGASTTGGDGRFDARRRQIGLALGPLLAALVLLLPLDLSPEAQRLAAVVTLVITFWVTEALPLAVTALLGPTLAVIFQVAPAGAAFVRRWSVQAGPPPFDDLLALDVVVLPLRLAESSGGALAPNQPGLVRLGALKRRR